MDNAAPHRRLRRCSLLRLHAHASPDNDTPKRAVHGKSRIEAPEDIILEISYPFEGLRRVELTQFQQTAIAVDIIGSRLANDLFTKAERQLVEDPFV